MRKLIESGGVAFAGLLTSLLTAGIVTLFNMWTSFNLFTFSIWFVIPAGAGVCGLAAASGYYIAARYLHQRPTTILLLQMVVIAAFTQFLIYWLEYQTLFVNGIHVATIVGFAQYLDISLTTAHMKIGRASSLDTGEGGSFRYWLAFLNFIGFIVGGVVLYFHLRSLSSCESRRKYLRSAIKKKYAFEELEGFSRYYDGVYAHPLGSPEFVEHVRAEHSVGGTSEGNISLVTTVLECPHCFAQSVSEKVQVFSGRDWKDVAELSRFVDMPKGVDVRPAFQ